MLCTYIYIYIYIHVYITDKRKEKGKKKQLEPTPVEKLLANTRHWKATEEHTFRELYKHAKVYLLVQFINLI